MASRVLRCGADGGDVSARDDWLVGVVGLGGELHGTFSALEVLVGVEFAPPRRRTAPDWGDPRIQTISRNNVFL